VAFGLSAGVLATGPAQPVYSSEPYGETSRRGVESPHGQLHGEDPQEARARQEVLLTTPVDDYELIAQKVSGIDEKVSRLEIHMSDVLTRMAT
jgi:hypothetical protein